MKSSDKNSWFRVFGSEPFPKSKHHWSIQIEKLSEGSENDISFGICTDDLYTQQKSKEQFLPSDIDIKGFYGICG